MARPIKRGLDYFPLDVDIDQDDKFQLIEALHGIEGFGITIKLLMRIYKEGFYYKWTETEQLLFSRRVNVNINTVQEVVNDCIKYGVFDKGMNEQNEILTSSGIQKRYFEAISRRKSVDAEESYLLVNAKNYPNVNRTIVNVNINPKSAVVNEDIGTQSKVKESKVKEIKSNTPVKKTFSELVRLTQVEYDRLTEEFTEPVIISKIEDLDNYMGSKGKTYKDHNRTIRSWLKRDGYKPCGQKPKIPIHSPMQINMSDGEG